MLSGHSSTFLLSCFNGLLCYQVIAAHSSCHVSMDSYVIRSQQHIPLVMFHWTLMLSGHSSTFLLSCFNGLLCYQVIAAHSSCHVSLDSYVIRSQQHIPLVMFHWTLMLSGHSSTFLLSCFNGLLCYQVIAAAPLVMFQWTLMLSGHSSTHSSCHVSLDSYVIRSQQHIPLVMFQWTLMLSGHSSTFLLSCFTGLLCYQVIAAAPLVMFHWTLMLSGHSRSSSCYVSLDSYVIRSQQQLLLSCFTGLLCYQVIAAAPLVMFHWTLMLSGHSSTYSSCHVSMDSYVIRSQLHTFLFSCFTGLLCYQVIAAAPLVMFQWTLMLSGHSSTHSSFHVSLDSYVIRSQQQHIPLVMFHWTLMLSGHSSAFLLSCFTGLLCYQVIAASPLVMFQWTLMLSGHSSTHSSCHVSLDSYVIRSQQHTFLLSCFNGLLCYQVIAAHIPLVMFQWTLMLSGHNSSSSCHVSMDSYVIRSQLHTFLLSCFNGLLCYQVITAASLVMFHWTLMLSGHSSTYSSCHVSLDSYVIRSQLHTFLLLCFNGLLCYQVITAAPLVMFQWTLML